MRRLLRKIAFTAFCSCYFVPFSQANVCVDPKIKEAQACGFVVDKFGEPVPNADISFHDATDTISAKTDDRGFFRRDDLPEAKIAVSVSAVGFHPAAQTIERLTRPSAGCRKPLYVLLQIGGDDCSMIRIKKSDLPIAKRD